MSFLQRCTAGMMALGAGLTGVGLGLMTPASAADAPSDADTPLIRTVEVGGAHGRYTETDERSNAEFLRMSWARPSTWDLRVDAGRQERFGATTYGGGVIYGLHVAPRTRVAFGMAGSTGELSPLFSTSVSVTHPWMGLGLTAGAAHSEWEGDARTEELSVGIVRWLPHVILGGGLRYYFADPGDNTVAGGIGATYYIWRKTYVGVGYDAGDLQLSFTGKGDEILDSSSRGFNIGLSQWIDDKSGVNLRWDTGRPPEVWGVTASWFREW
jgi:hypothetical protein